MDYHPIREQYKYSWTLHATETRITSSMMSHFTFPFCLTLKLYLWTSSNALINNETNSYKVYVV